MRGKFITFLSFGLEYSKNKDKSNDSGLNDCNFIKIQKKTLKIKRQH